MRQISDGYRPRRLPFFFDAAVFCRSARCGVTGCRAALRLTDLLLSRPDTASAAVIGWRQLPGNRWRYVHWGKNWLYWIQAMKWNTYELPIANKKRLIRPYQYFGDRISRRRTFRPADGFTQINEAFLTRSLSL